jgi:hypothetical protein
MAGGGSVAGNRSHAPSPACERHAVAAAARRDREATTRAAHRVLPARALAITGHLRPPAVAAGDPARAARRRCRVLPLRPLPRELPPRMQPPPRRHRCPGGRVNDHTARPADGLDVDRAYLDRRRRVPPLATSQDTDRDSEALRHQFAGRDLLLGVDRLDYTKGIVERLLAVERHIGQINGQFTEPGSDVPIPLPVPGTAAAAARRLLRGRHYTARHTTYRRDEPHRQGIHHRPPHRACRHGTARSQPRRAQLRWLSNSLTSNPAAPTDEGLR